MVAASDQPPRSKDGEAPQGYRIGAGDMLEILVWKEPDASVRDAIVRADGKLALPLIGEIDAAGLTPSELQEVLVKKLSQFINTPVVTVITKEVRSRLIYVMGSVRKEGPIRLVRPMNVLDAILEAGGLGMWAKKSKIYVLRSDGGKQEKLPFDYAAFLKGKHLDQNRALMPGDMVIVPPLTGGSEAPGH